VDPILSCGRSVCEGGGVRARKRGIGQCGTSVLRISISGRPPKSATPTFTAELCQRLDPKSSIFIPLNHSLACQKRQDGRRYVSNSREQMLHLPPQTSMASDEPFLISQISRTLRALLSRLHKSKSYTTRQRHDHS
jgi:hypothetical protein